MSRATTGPIRAPSEAWIVSEFETIRDTSGTAPLTEAGVDTREGRTTPSAGGNILLGWLTVNLPASTDTDLAADLRLAVGRLARRLRQLQLAGLTASKVSALASVDRLGPVRLGDLAAAEGVSSPTLTKLVDSLEAEGLVARSADATDRRATRVALTPAGRLRLKQIRSDRDAFLEQRLAQLTREERATLLAAIPVLRDLAAEGER